MRIRLLAGILSAMTVMVLFGAQQASADGSFAWDATIKYGLSSRHWNTSSYGDQVIVAYSDCKDSGQSAGITYYTIRLYQAQDSSTNDKLIGSPVNYACGKKLQYTWKGTVKGEYYFMIRKADNGKYIYVTGSVTYP